MDGCYFGVVAGRLIEIQKSNTRTTSYKSGKLKCINYRIGLFCGYKFCFSRFVSYYYCHTLHKQDMDYERFYFLLSCRTVDILHEKPLPTASVGTNIRPASICICVVVEAVASMLAREFIARFHPIIYFVFTKWNAIFILSLNNSSLVRNFDSSKNCISFLLFRLWLWCLSSGCDRTARNSIVDTVTPFLTI